MSNGEVCCILGVCCPPERQRRAIVMAIMAHGLDEATGDKVADAMQPYLQPRVMLKALAEHWHDPERG